MFSPRECNPFLVWQDSDKPQLLWIHTVLICACHNFTSMENFNRYFMLCSVIKILKVSLEELWRAPLMASLQCDTSLLSAVCYQTPSLNPSPLHRCYTDSPFFSLTSVFPCDTMSNALAKFRQISSTAFPLSA